MCWQAYLVFRCRGRPDDASATTGTTGPTGNAGPTYNATDGCRAPTTKFSHLRGERGDRPEASLTASGHAHGHGLGLGALPPTAQPLRAEVSAGNMRLSKLKLLILSNRIRKV